eukprot:TRINITY_DN70245_c0_g1_i1.p1 TRINITY_DN70245_c0_g1~~TRINITY_DN70245_c0_g1_i1.p1  ORF type:complete len:441 (+),score=84.61 TRINITY_DN70245_c0_g1_i1:73-1395(+)
MWLQQAAGAARRRSVAASHSRVRRCREAQRAAPAAALGRQLRRNSGGGGTPFGSGGHQITDIPGRTGAGAGGPSPSGAPPLSPEEREAAQEENLRAVESAYTGEGRNQFDFLEQVRKSRGETQDLKQQFRDLTYGAKEQPQFAFGEGPTDSRDSGYMQDKSAKFEGSAEQKVDLPDATTAAQLAARAAAMATNPFAAEGPGKGPGGMASFMDYVETEQDYYQRGQDQRDALMVSRGRAREVARRRAAEARTEEALGPEAINQLRIGANRTAPITIHKYDMRTFTLSNGVRVVGSCVLFKSTYYLWDVTTVEDITMEKLMPLAHIYPVPVFIFIGMGMEVEPLHPDLHMFMRTRGTRLECMKTDKAIANYNQCLQDGYPCCGVFMPYEPCNGFDFVDYHSYWRMKRKVAHGDGLSHSQRGFGNEFNAGRSPSDPRAKNLGA